MRTAIILTGGSGSRLAPITLTMNKGLVPIDGMPVVERIIRQLENSGIDKVIVLAGHLAWQVEFFLKNRPSSSLTKIVISKTPPLFSPAERLLETKDLWVDASEVVLIYCDNLLEDFEIAKHLENVSSEQRVLVQRRAPGNIHINDSGQVQYEVHRRKEFNFVELGFWILKASGLFRNLVQEKELPQALKNLTLLEDIYATEVANYRTLSDLSRYAEDRKKNRKTIFLDRDGIVIESIGKGSYVRKENQIQFLKDNLEFFSHLSTSYGADFIVVTNQAGIERGLVTQGEVDFINQVIAIRMLERGIPIIAFYVCPHHWDSNCDCRKPKPGMINSAISDFKLNPYDCILIGDRLSDIESGQNAGVKSFLFSEVMEPAERILIQKQVIESLTPGNLY